MHRELAGNRALDRVVAINESFVARHDLLGIGLFAGLRAFPKQRSGLVLTPSLRGKK